MLATRPRFKARLSGVFELAEGLTSTFGQTFVLGSLVVSGDAAATAANVLGRQPFFWWGFAASLVAVAFHLVWISLFYELFVPVERSIARLAAFAGIVGCAIQAMAAAFSGGAALFLNAAGSSAFAPEQARALTYFSLAMSRSTFDIYLVFFGLWSALSGYLIFRSTFLPRILGVLLAIDGVAWLSFLWPPFATHNFHYLAIASALGELPLICWLLAIGVNEPRWLELSANST